MRTAIGRPSITCLASAARVFAHRALAVILTGNGSDGAEGALAVCHAGGVVIAQDEASSEYFNMPREVISAGAATVVLPLDSIAMAITRLVRDGRAVLAELGQTPNGERTARLRRGGESPLAEPKSPGS
jgi:chemotaxis response regulator CheB